MILLTKHKSNQTLDINICMIFFHENQISG